MANQNDKRDEQKKKNEQRKGGETTKDWEETDMENPTSGGMNQDNE